MVLPFGSAFFVGALSCEDAIFGFLSRALGQCLCPVPCALNRVLFAEPQRLVS